MDKFFETLRSVYSKFHDVLLFPGKYLNEYVGHGFAVILFIITCIALMVVACFILHILYVHLVLNTAFVVTMIRLQLRHPELEFISLSFRRERPRSWMLIYLKQYLTCSRVLDWHYSSDRITINGYCFHFDGILTFRLQAPQTLEKDHE